MTKKSERIFLVVLLLSSSFRVMALENPELSALKTKVEQLKLEKIIHRRLFLPELNLTGGLGSEKLLDNDYMTDRGPFLFLEGKLNLYHGGQDQNLRESSSLELSGTLVESEIKKREIAIQHFEINSEIEYLNKDNLLIENELKSNNSLQSMARKKVEANLSTKADLIDFDLKNQNLENAREKNLIRIEDLKAKLSLLGNSAADQLTKESISEVNQYDPASTPQVVLTNIHQKISELTILNAKSAYRPSVDLIGKWGQLTPKGQFLSAEREHMVALNVTIPLFSGFSTKATVNQAVLENTQKIRLQKYAKKETEASMAILLRKIALSKKILSTLDRSRSQSSKYRELTIGEYRRGVKNSPDLLSAANQSFEFERKALETDLELKKSLFTYHELYKPVEKTSGEL